MWCCWTLEDYMLTTVIGCPEGHLETLWDTSSNSHNEQTPECPQAELYQTTSTLSQSKLIR